MRKGPFGRYIVATRDIQPLGIFNIKFGVAKSDDNLNLYIL